MKCGQNDHTPTPEREGCSEPLGGRARCGQPAVAELIGAGWLFSGPKCTQHALGWADGSVHWYTDEAQS